MNQYEIAKKLNLSQPTVSKHIKVGRDVVNDNLKYCLIALSRAERDYDKLM